MSDFSQASPGPWCVWCVVQRFAVCTTAVPTGPLVTVVGYVHLPGEILYVRLWGLVRLTWLRVRYFGKGFSSLEWYAGTVYWYGILEWYADVVQWNSMLVWYNGIVCWYYILVWHTGMIYWYAILVCYNAILYWYDTMVWYTGMVYRYGILVWHTGMVRWYTIME